MHLLVAGKDIAGHTRQLCSCLCNRKQNVVSSGRPHLLRRALWARLLSLPYVHGNVADIVCFASADTPPYALACRPMQC